MLDSIKKDVSYVSSFASESSDIKHAITLLEEIIEDKEIARHKGEIGQRSVHKQFDKNTFTDELFELVVSN